MQRKTSTVILIALLLALLAAILILAPKTLDAYKTLQTELHATATPTADISSALLVTMDPASTPAPTALLLKIGVKGDEVVRLQQRLLSLGYYSGEVDGQYGQGTAESVRLFQAQHGLTADGVAGERTCAALYADNAQTYLPTPAPTATPSVLQMGDDNDAVRALQKRLKELDYYAGHIDGDFGAGTQAAVRLFQSQNGLEADGIAAAKTMAVLYSDAAAKAVPTPTPDPNGLPPLVNKTHPLSADYVPGDLVKLRDTLPSSLVYVKASDIRADRAAASALQTMLEAAKAEGVTGWQVSTAYRTYADQQAIFDKSVQKYLADGMSEARAISATRQTVADPGTSEHQTGLAFDITVADTTFSGTPQQKWLAKNCWDYGFIVRYQEDKEKITGFLAECWHIRYVGAAHSVPMRDQNLCLEEYLGE